MATTRSRIALYLDPRVVQTLNILSEKTGRPADEILENALNLYVATRFPEIQPRSGPQGLIELLDELEAKRPDAPSDEEAQRIAYEELHAIRRERRLR